MKIMLTIILLATVAYGQKPGLEAHIGKGTDPTKAVKQPAKPPVKKKVVDKQYKKY